MARLMIYLYAIMTMFSVKWRHITANGSRKRYSRGSGRSLQSSNLKIKEVYKPRNQRELLRPGRQAHNGVQSFVPRWRSRHAWGYKGACNPSQTRTVIYVTLSD